MQFLSISRSTTLTELADLVGPRNVDAILAINDLPRVPQIGVAFYASCEDVVSSSSDVDWQRKSTVLNTFTQDSDVFESAALMGASGWKVLSAKGTFPTMLRVPETVKLPDSTQLIGNGIGVSSTVYKQTMQSLQTPPHHIDPAIFNEYSTIKPARLVDMAALSSDPFQWFKLPWGDVTLFSSLSNDSKDFPVYPEEIEDSTSATYATMPDTIYQYEPWYMYSGSGPRSNTYKFDMHRDMWTGDHRDGKCNELLRFCEANCYPEYNGSAVNTALVTLYVKGKALITGIMTDWSVSWDGPLGLDGWYLHCTLQLTITEVADHPLNYAAIRNKGLIG